MSICLFNIGYCVFSCVVSYLYCFQLRVVYYVLFFLYIYICCFICLYVVSLCIYAVQYYVVFVYCFFCVLCLIYVLLWYIYIYCFCYYYSLTKLYTKQKKHCMHSAARQQKHFSSRAVPWPGHGANKYVLMQFITFCVLPVCMRAVHGRTNCKNHTIHQNNLK